MSSHCPLCGMQLTSAGCPNYLSHSIRNVSCEPKGWECPKCGRVYAPATMECSACNMKINHGLK